MAIMKNLPSIEYSGYILADISKRISIVKAIKENPALYQEIELQGDESPEHLAQDFYEDPNLYWLVYMMNDILDPFYGWVLSGSELSEFITDKYGSGNELLIHHYEWEGTPVGVTFGACPPPQVPLETVIVATSPINYWQLDETTGIIAFDTMLNLDLYHDNAQADWTTPGVSVPSLRGDNTGTALGSTGYDLSKGGGVPTDPRPFRSGSFTFSLGISLNSGFTGKNVPLGISGEGFQYCYFHLETTGLWFLAQPEGNWFDILIATTAELSTGGFDPDGPAVWLTLELNTTGSSITVYINDTFVSNTAVTTVGGHGWRYQTAARNNFTYDGFGLDVWGETWDGARDDVVYWDRVLTAQEKTDIYNAWAQAAQAACTPLPLIPITNTGYEEGINDKKRKVKVIRPNYVTDIKQLVEKAIRS